MNHRKRIAGYIVVLATLVGVFLAGPVAWATPGQSPMNQTVPTNTPAPPPEPPGGGGGGGQPADTPSPATPAPGETPAPTVTGAAAGQGARLQLEKRANRDRVWPGASVDFTLILSNVGNASARQVIIEDPLPAGLMPGEITQGAGAGWSQRTLRAQLPVMPPGGKYSVVFRTFVSPDATGATLINRANASAAGGLTAKAAYALALPPSELPPVGGSPERVTMGGVTRR